MSKVRKPNLPEQNSQPFSRYGHEGVAFVATLRGTPGRDVLDTALVALRGLDHGQSRSSGMLTHIPHNLLRQEVDGLPARGAYALGFIYLSPNDVEAEQRIVHAAAAQEGFALLVWREVPVNDTIVDIDARSTMPVMYQFVLIPSESGSSAVSGEAVDTGLYRLRKTVENISDAYFASLSRTTVVYKGLVPATHLALLYGDLADSRYRTEIAVVHSGGRESIWGDAQPHRILAHDGQIHSITANRTWLTAREPQLESELVNEGDRFTPVISSDHSPEACLDEVVQLLHRGGRSLTHALRMVIPEQWEESMTAAEQAFYAYNSTVVEPWEGSGVTCFAEGHLVGAVLDRHGQRNGRYWVTETGMVVFSPEAGVVDLDPSSISKKGRLAPGELIAVDTKVGQVLSSAAVTGQLATAFPYEQWLEDNLIELVATPMTAPESIDSEAYQISPGEIASVAAGDYEDRLREPDLEVTFFDRFHTPRPQLTTPSVDAVTSPTPKPVVIGPRADLLGDGADHAHKIVVPSPIIDNGQLRSLFKLSNTVRISGLYPRSEGSVGLGAALDRIGNEVDTAIGDGARVLVLTNRGARNSQSVPVPSLLLTAAVHQHLLRNRQRARVSLVVEAGDALTATHVGRLLSAGATSVVPYHGIQLAPQKNDYLAALTRGIQDEMHANGISNFHSFKGGQNYHIVGLAPELVQRYFPGARHALGALTLDDLGEQLLQRPGPLQPLHDLIQVAKRDPIELKQVEAVEQIAGHFQRHKPLVLTATREGVSLHRLAEASDVLLSPPPHHDIVGPGGLAEFVDEIRQVNPSAQIHARVGSDLTTGIAAIEAAQAGIDIVSVVDSAHEWLLGVISAVRALQDGAEDTRIAVGTPLETAHHIFVAAALGASEFWISEKADRRSIAEDLRQLLASVGVARFVDVFGNGHLLDWRVAKEQWLTAGVDLDGLFTDPPLGLSLKQDRRESLDDTLIALAEEAINDNKPVHLNAYVTNNNTSVGAKISGEIARLYGPEGLPHASVSIMLTGAAGAALGAYLAPGLSVTVQGEAGDFVGKGLSGGQILVRPERTASFSSQGNVIAGSSIGYGATGGTIYLSGTVGERLGAYNGGATIVCEGAGGAVGYRMRDGILVVLGDTGANLGAGMTGGTLYVLDLNPGQIHEAMHARGGLSISEIDEVDERVLTALLAEHAEGTRSRLATLLLNEPDEIRSRFQRIQPPGYIPKRRCGDAGIRTVWDRVLAATGQESSFEGP